MTAADQKWIRRKELAFLIGVSYSTIRRNEIRLGLSEIQVRLSPRMVLFPRAKAIEKLKAFL